MTGSESLIAVSARVSAELAKVGRRSKLLSDIAWHTTGLPSITRALGTDREEQMVYVVDDKGRLIGIDLRHDLLLVDGRLVLLYFVYSRQLSSYDLG